MKYREIIRFVYHYECSDCDYKFTKNYRVNPYTCYRCEGYDTFTEEREEVDELEQYCPLCNDYFITSKYLNTVLKDSEHVRWIANMVTHYRHNHVTSWNKMWGWRGGYYRAAFPEKDYDVAKQEYNERAKRQIIRKATNYLLEHGFLPEHFAALMHTTEKTMRLAQKKLGGRRYSMAS